MVMGILALVRSKLFGIGLAALAALVFYGYMRWSRAEMTALRGQVTLISKQADDMQAANNMIRQQIDGLIAAQKQVQSQMNGARADAASAVRTVRALNLHKAAATDPSALEDQINQTWSVRSQKIEDQSHVHP